jgi:hypothetical protein
MDWRITKMNDPVYINRTTLLNHLAVLQTENEDMFDIYEMFKSIVRKMPKEYPTISHWERHGDRIVCNNCNHSVEDIYYDYEQDC